MDDILLSAVASL